MNNKRYHLTFTSFLQSILISIKGLIKKIIRERNKKSPFDTSISNNEYSEYNLKKYNNNRLSHVLNNASNNTDFYHNTLNNKTTDIEDFPYISKKKIIQHPEAFKNKKKPNLIINGSTSGTTGTPLSIYQSLDSVIREQAFISRILTWAGYKKGDKRAWLRGDIIMSPTHNKPPFWRYSWFEDMILLSSFHMSSEALPLYIQAMVDYGVDIIQGYPSSVVTLAKYLESKDQYYPSKIKSIITSSESLSQENRQVIEERFQCKVFDHYGLFERVAAISNCEFGRYHVLTDYSYVEFLDAGNGTHEIVGTNFNNLYYPLIRYRTGDHVVLSKEKECPCGRAFPLIDRIEGRVGTPIYASNGSKVYILNRCIKGVEGVLSSQFVQHYKNEITVRVVASNAFNDKQHDKLVANVQAYLGDDLKVSVDLVDKLQRTKNGKIQQAVCNIMESA